MNTPLVIVLSAVLAGGVAAANQLGAQTTATPPVSTTTPTGAPTGVSLATVQSVVEITRVVPAGATAIDAFTVPAGVTLVVTDILVTNTGTTAVCGGAVTRAGGTPTTVTPSPSTGAAGTPTSTTPALATPPTTITSPPPGGNPTTDATATTAAPGAAPGSTVTTSTGTLTQTDSTVTGPICVPAQTTTTLPFTTGIEFGSGQVVQLLNAPTAAGTPIAASGSLAFHLRGVLMTLS